MKKQILCMLLAIVMVVGVIPVTVLAENDDAARNTDGSVIEDKAEVSVTSSTPALRFRHMDRDKSTGAFYEDTTRVLSSQWNTVMGGGSPVKFYFFDGTNDIPVTFNDLTFPDIVSATQVSGEDYVNLFAVACGSGKISYNTGDKEYSIPVTIGLPDFGLYSGQTASGDTYLTRFDVTNENNTFFLVANEKCTLTAVTLMGNLSNIADAEKVSDTCWKITVTGNPTANVYSLQYSGTNKSGMPFENRGMSFQIYDARSYLFYKFKADGYPMRLSELNSAPSNTIGLLLYYGTEMNLTPLKGGTLTSSDLNTIRIDNYSDSEGKYYISVLDWGSATLTYKDAGNTYSENVVIDIPDGVAYYSSNMRSQDTYLSKLIYDQENGTVLWLMSKYGFTAGEMETLDVTVNGATVPGVTAAEVERSESGVYDIRITLEKDLKLKGSIRVSWGEWSFISTGLQIKERPRLLYRELSPANTGAGPATGPATLYENTALPLQGCETLFLSLNHSRNLRFYYGTVDNAVPVDVITVTEGESVVLTPCTAQGNTPYQQLNCVAFGTSVLSFTVDGEVHTQELGVELPNTAFYSEQNRSQDTYLSRPIYDQENGSVLWLMAKDGFTSEDLQNLSVQIGGSTVSGVKAEKAERGSSGVFDIKVTLEKELNLQGSIRVTWGAGRFINAGLQIKERPRLLYRVMSMSVSGNGPAAGPSLGGTFYENVSTPLCGWENLNLMLNNSINARFYYGTVDNAVPVDAISVTAGTSVVLTPGTAAGNTPYMTLNCEEAGTSVLTFTVDGKTHTQELNVKFPIVALYSSPIRSAESYIGGYINHRELTNGAVWLISENGFTSDELATLIVKEKDVAKDNWTPVERAPGSGRYDVRIMVTAPISILEEYSLNVSFERNGYTQRMNNLVGIYIPSNAAYFGDYAVGFVWIHDQTEIARINEGEWRFRGSISGDPTEDFKFLHNLKIAAGTKHMDEQGAEYFIVDESNDVKLKILKTWIEIVDGDEGSFSLSPSILQTQKTDYADDVLDVDVFFHQVRSGALLLWATVEVTIDGVTETADISMLGVTSLGPGAEIDIKIIKRPADDTVSKLNEELAKLAADMRGACIYEVELAPIDYVGTIVIPEAFHAGSGGNKNLSLEGTYDAQTQKGTVINGSLNLNGSTLNSIKDISFRAADESAAIYGGSLLNMYRCSFADYAIAVDSSYGMITLTEGNVFVNNGIAARLDVAVCHGGMNALPWTYNTFINNGTAVQIVSLNDFISSYYFRVVNSNFINNNTDFDAQCRATLYMYKNYYGEYKNKGNGLGPKPGAPSHNNGNGRDDLRLEEVLAAKTEKKLDKILKACTAKVAVSGGARVFTNPKWQFPVKDWWKGSTLIGDAIFGKAAVQSIMLFDLEQEYENILVSDWDLATQIVNGEAQDLLIDVSAFEKDGEKQIDVVDETENSVGIWNFGASDERGEGQP